jgi:hypothetical protein
MNPFSPIPFFGMGVGLLDAYNAKFQTYAHTHPQITPSHPCHSNDKDWQSPLSIMQHDEEKEWQKQKDTKAIQS